MVSPSRAACIIIGFVSLITAAKAVGWRIQRNPFGKLAFFHISQEYEIVIDNVTCTDSSDLLQNISCITNSMKNGTRTLSLEAYAIKPIDHIFVSSFETSLETLGKDYFNLNLDS